MPLPSRNLGRCFDATRDPDKIAIVDLALDGTAREISYGALDQDCDAVARGLLGRGLVRGDRVGLLAANSGAFAAAYLGTMRAGLVAVPISHKLPPDTIEHIARDAALKVVFHDAERREQVPAGVAAIDFDDPDGYAAFLDPGPFETVAPEGRELAMILYTSGSTGRPKGVLLSHESQAWSLETLLRTFGDRSRHRYIVAAPLFHMNATFNLKSTLAAGASLVLMRGFDPRLFAEAIARFRVTWVTSVPTMLALVAREASLLAGLDLASIENVYMGSAPLTQALVDKVTAVFPGAQVRNGYGTTEAGPAPFGPHPDGLEPPPTSCGYPYPGSECELREGASPDEGVLYMRSPMLMEGYNNLPQKTAEVMIEGWYRSGDIMRRDANGFFHFVGRADDMFVVGGENVWPGEVEKLLERMPGIQQAAVVPVPDEVKGALPFAFVVRQDGAAIDEAAVKAFSIANGPAFAHPRFIAFRDRIPLAATNKPDRRLLIEEARALAASGPRGRTSGEASRR